MIEACNPRGNKNFNGADCVGLAQTIFFMAGWGHRGGFCEKLLEAATVSNRVNL